jgi:hypothetical protein
MEALRREEISLTKWPTALSRGKHGKGVASMREIN